MLHNTRRKRHGRKTRGERFRQAGRDAGGSGSTKGTLIPILQKAQDIFGYLPREVLVYISQKTGVPLSQ
ncbi:MAG: NAD(P)H-dependent oxidoreductase subunit E, partial [Synergistaceae bacterium]|nr:NAD(P)H-dependent oxidoreductase subunit E [Synergistaceae bacterium]